jgi:hypothetical protein
MPQESNDQIESARKGNPRLIHYVLTLIGVAVVVIVILVVLGPSTGNVFFSVGGSI